MECENPWLDAERLLFQGYEGELPAKIESHSIEPNRTFIASISSGQVLDKSDTRSKIIDSCASRGSARLLIQHAGDYFVTPRIVKLSDLDGQPRGSDLCQWCEWARFLPDSCEVYGVRSDRYLVSLKGGRPEFKDDTPDDDPAEVINPADGSKRRVPRWRQSAWHGVWVGQPADRLAAVVVSGENRDQARLALFQLDTGKLQHLETDRGPWQRVLAWLPPAPGEAGVR